MVRSGQEWPGVVSSEQGDREVVCTRTSLLLATYYLLLGYLPLLLTTHYLLLLASVHYILLSTLISASPAGSDMPSLRASDA